GLIHFVHALVADVAVAEVPEPVPAIVDEVLVEGRRLGGPGPDVEVEFGGRGLGRFEADVAAGAAAGAAILVTEAARHEQLAVLSALGERGHLSEAGTGPALRAVLYDPLLFMGRVHRDAALMHVVAARL